MAGTHNAVLLVVLDGWGYSEDTRCNAIHAARTPEWDRLWSECPHTLIRCSGTDVGLPDNQMGNSEVGHMHIGAGRLINQELTRVSKTIEDGTFFDNPALTTACRNAARAGRAVHVLGLVSPGGVHSHERHIHALIVLAARAGAPRIFAHAFLDGRDTPPSSAAASLEALAACCAATKGARIGTVIGRYYAMDRNKNWERTKRAYDAIVEARGEHRSASAAAALEAAYARGETDEFVKATVIDVPNDPYPGLQDGDVVLFANFRADRARQLTSSLAHDDFKGFARHRRVSLGGCVSMTDYGKQFAVPIAFPPVSLKNTYGELIAARGLKQLRIAETEKYAHVTFFFNGGMEQPYPGEDRILVPSPAVATYDLKPEMSAVEVTDRLIAAIESHRYATIICNYANADMVGHSGDFDATVRCIEVLDTCLGRLADACAQAGMDMIITSDHGNAEKMCETGPDGDSEPHTAHTSNLVPFIHVGRPAEIVGSGSLIDVAPTMLYLLGLPIPREMTGRPLVRLRASQDSSASRRAAGEA
jgi:2,3-bisphosphoglycerate-independent phosphoglycerate mutase